MANEAPVAPSYIHPSTESGQVCVAPRFTALLRCPSTLQLLVTMGASHVQKLQVHSQSNHVTMMTAATTLRTQTSRSIPKTFFTDCMILHYATPTNWESVMRFQKLCAQFQPPSAFWGDPVAGFRLQSWSSSTFLRGHQARNGLMLAHEGIINLQHSPTGLECGTRLLTGVVTCWRSSCGLPHILPPCLTLPVSLLQPNLIRFGSVWSCF